MNSITMAKAFQLTSPNPFTLVCTATPEGRANLAAVSWWTYLSSGPPHLCFAMSQTSYSGELVRNNKKVVLAMPGADIAEAAFKCGTVSGKKTDKAKEFAIELMDFSDSSIRIPVHTRLAFDCTLEETVKVGDHNLYICAINSIYADETKKQIFAWDGYAKLGPLS